MTLIRVCEFAAVLLLSPVLFGIINRVKAFFAGRKGQHVLQTYFDIAKLLRKGVVYSDTTTWLFRLGPVVALSTAAGAAAMAPFAGDQGLIGFDGDFILLAYLLALGRFATVLSALDTGSSFEGMGASREVKFSALAEIPLFVTLAALCKVSGSMSLGGIYGAINPQLWLKAMPAIILSCGAIVVVLLAENSRIPVDDPNTHLELTMIHEVMVLDNSGPDLAFITYASSLKLWVFCSLAAGIMLPFQTRMGIAGVLVFLASMAFMAALVGVVESCMARLKMTRVSQMILIAGGLSVFALVLAL